MLVKVLHESNVNGELARGVFTPAYEAIGHVLGIPVEIRLGALTLSRLTPQATLPEQINGLPQHSALLTTRPLGSPSRGRDVALSGTSLGRGAERSTLAVVRLFPDDTAGDLQRAAHGAVARTLGLGALNCTASPAECVRGTRDIIDLTDGRAVDAVLQRPNPYCGDCTDTLKIGGSGLA